MPMTRIVENGWPFSIANARHHIGKHGAKPRPGHYLARAYVRETLLHPTDKRANPVVADIAVDTVELGRARVIRAGSDLTLVSYGAQIKEAAEAMPHNFVLGAVIRDGEVLIPRGKTVLEPQDHLVMFVETDVSAEVLEAL